MLPDQLPLFPDAGDVVARRVNAYAHSQTTEVELGASTRKLPTVTRRRLQCAVSLCLANDGVSSEEIAPVLMGVFVLSTTMD